MGIRSVAQARTLSRSGKTLQAEWAYAISYQNHWHRRAALPRWLRYYNCERPHSALGHKTPISRLQADERSKDLQLGDLASVLDASTYRIIGGHIVTALVARWQLGAELYRETGDIDLGVSPVVVREEGVIGRLIERGYEQVAGNRFARPIDDVPVTVRAAEGLRSAVVDVLVPSYRTRARSNHRVSDDLVTTEVPGLALALQREPVLLRMELHRLNGEQLDVEVAFPGEVAALTLKAFASQVRDKPTDVVDLWRCLEIAFAAGTGAAAFVEGEAADAARIARALFDRRDGAGMSALAGEQRLSQAAADERFTRIRALIQRVLPSSVSHD